MTSAAPRRTGPHVLIEMMVTTAAAVKMCTYLAEMHVPQASTSTQLPVEVVHPTAIQLMDCTHHALHARVRLLPILVLLTAFVQPARTGMKHPAFSVQLAHT